MAQDTADSTAEAAEPSFQRQVTALQQSLAQELERVRNEHKRKLDYLLLDQRLSCLRFRISDFLKPSAKDLLARYTALHAHYKTLCGGSPVDDDSPAGPAPYPCIEDSQGLVVESVYELLVALYAQVCAKQAGLARVLGMDDPETACTETITKFTNTMAELSRDGMPEATGLVLDTVSALEPVHRMHSNLFFKQHAFHSAGLVPPSAPGVVPSTKLVPPAIGYARPRVEPVETLPPTAYEKQFALMSDVV